MCCAVVQLNMRGTVSLCEQQSAAIHIHCVTVWVCSRKKAKKSAFGFFISVRPSSCNNSINAESIFMTFDDMPFLHFLSPSNYF